MNELNQVLETLIDVLQYAQALGEKWTPDQIKAVGGEVALNELEIDSLATMELLVAVELEFGLTLTTKQVRSCQTLKDISGLINQSPVHDANDGSERGLISDVGDNAASKIVRLYQRLSKNSLSRNRRGKIHAALDNRITPAELETLAAYYLGCPEQVAGDPFHDFTQHWLEGLIARMPKQSWTGNQQFKRRRLAHGVELYADSGATDDKKLLLCFCGNMQRLMMPLPLFLAHLDPNEFDVLLVKDTGRKGFREGVPNYASSAAELLNKLAALHPFDRYTNRYAFGTSGGGAIALLAGCMFDFDATSVVGASDSGFRTMVEDESDWLSLRRSQGNQRPTITLVYGSQSRVDKRAAIALDEMLGVHHTEITSAAESMKHNCLYSVVKAGRFSELLSTTLLLPDASELQSAAAPLSQFEV